MFINSYILFLLPGSPEGGGLVCVVVHSQIELIKFLIKSLISVNGIYFTIPSIITALVKRLVVVVSMLGNILRIILNISLDYSGFTRRISGPYPGTSLPSLSLG